MKKQPTRKSCRTKKGVNYKELNEGKNEPLSEGSTEFLAHVASQEHEKCDLGHAIICTEDNWFKRGVKEAIAIPKMGNYFEESMEIQKSSEVLPQMQAYGPDADWNQAKDCSRRQSSEKYHKKSRKSPLKCKNKRNNQEKSPLRKENKRN